MNFATILFAAFFLIGATIAGFGVRTVLQARESATWPSAQGIILSSTVKTQSDSDGTTYKPEVTYTYTVDGTEYRGDLIAYGMKGSSASYGFAQHYDKKYPEGSTIPVAYDPAKPQTSVLEPGVSKRAFITVAFGAIFAINGLLFGLIWWLFTP
ncbi:MAG: hypothetical protein BGO12_18025 [Verrucomicrobia bacterium 61-8]|nr:DUF3592 domain-containing protein [Verrucomicrobiota bacterium]OJV04231.1 MAG: hypothetical protein BGO12_18025 [Verrucomicrobia bacterium 61-8]